MPKGRMYFAYGSNINLDQMSVRCPNATVIGPVTLNNYELTFRGRMDGCGVANIEPKKGSAVPGLLWRITSQCEAALYIYEGAPRFYEQKMITVRDMEGHRHRVMAYIMTPDPRDHALPSSDYFHGICRGYAQNGLPQEFLDAALKHCKEEIYKAQEECQTIFPRYDRHRTQRRRYSHER